MKKKRFPGNYACWLVGPVAIIIATAACNGTSPPAPVLVAQATTLAPSPSPTATTTATNTATATPTLTPTSTPTPSPTATASPTLTPTSTPNPLLGYTIEGLRTRNYPGGTIELLAVLTTTSVYTRYYMAYPSDNLTITGIIQMPQGQGPFPVAILNHGYIPPSRYWSGADTWKAADYLAGRDYLTIAPDFRGWGESDSGDNFFRTGLVIDVLNLISSLPSLPQADSNRVGMWGHSMGGGVTTKAITLDPRIKAAILYGPVSADDVEVMSRWGRGSRGGGEDSLLAEAYREAVRDKEFLQLTSPLNYFGFVTASVQIHQGAVDNVTPPEWAEAIHTALQSAGKEVEYFSYPGQGHAFEGESWELFMDRVADFFDQHL